jgi:hypothetical protein
MGTRHDFDEKVSLCMDGFYGLLITDSGAIDENSTRAVLCRENELIDVIDDALSNDAALIQLVARNTTVYRTRLALTVETAAMLAARPVDNAYREPGRGEARAIIAIYEHTRRTHRFMCVGENLAISAHHAFELLVRDGAKALKIARGTSRARAIAAVLQWMGRPAL